MNEKVIIEARHISKKFGAITAVDDLSLSVPPGICFGLLAATVLTLLYVPALYLIIADITKLFSSKTQEEVARKKIAEDKGA